jgi:threonine/homoserine/homoserine lactone efflux protein
MTPLVFASAMLAGVVYVLTPGPAVLAVLGIGAAQGRRAAFAFVIGHGAGDVLWAVLAILSLVGTGIVAPAAVRALALVCGGYLLWLGLQALFARRRAGGGTSFESARPLLRGALFGLTNPKAFPVTLAVFTALVAGQVTAPGPGLAVAVLLAYLLGVLVGDAILAWLVATAALRAVYRRYDIWIVRLTGCLFIAFAAHVLWTALPI